MQITEAPGGATERTWRPPLETRIAVAFCNGLILILPAGFLAITLWTNQVPDALWVTLACALAAWSFLAWRTLAQSVTLTPDRLVVRNVFTTNQIPLAQVTEVGFHRSKLTVTSQHGPFAIRTCTVGTAVLGYSYWSGRRSRADSIADAINHAAGLPPLPPRREIISPSRTRALLVAAVVLFGVGAYLGPIGSTRLHHHSFALTEVGSTAWVFGIGALGFAFRLTLDHRRKRAR